VQPLSPGEGKVELVPVVLDPVVVTLEVEEAADLIEDADL
jgi:hypothetical protein